MPHDDGDGDDDVGDNNNDGDDDNGEDIVVEGNNISFDCSQDDCCGLSLETNIYEEQCQP